MDKPTKEPPKKVKIPKLVRFQGDLVEEVLHVPAKMPFKIRFWSPCCGLIPKAQASSPLWKA
jgi:hypothetical protein